MSVESIDAKLLSKMFLAGAASLEARKEYINDLNVFPVPDGDTGTNMTMTILSAVGEVSVLEDPSMKELSKAISSGSLRGARGNSGVILSQLLRGFSRTIADTEEIDINIMAEAFEKAVETAYKAVMKPMEGTILTVARNISEKASDMKDTGVGFEEFSGAILEVGQEALDKTPELLPVLKEAGVVDSGGAGLLEILKGARDALLGKEVDYSKLEANEAPRPLKISKEVNDDIKFGYCR